MATCRAWDGSALTTGWLALVLSGDDSTGPSAFTATCGAEPVIVPVAEVGKFLAKHATCRVACHDAARLHGVIAEHLHGDRAGMTVLWSLSQSGRLYDI